jgi:hypothetical protein
MKTTKFYLFAFMMLFVCQMAISQLKVRNDGSVWTGYTGYPNLWIGTYPSGSYDNGKWGIENWGDNLNIWKPWPSPWNGVNRNYYLFINVAGGVGVGKAPTQSGICLDVNGYVYSYGNLLTSDERLKTDIKSLGEKTSGLYSLNGKSYKKHISEERLEMPEQKDKDGKIPEAKQQNNFSKIKTEKYEFGFLAQELKIIYPELVTQDTLGIYYVNYIGLIPVLVEAIKEQKNQIDDLTTKVNSLSNSEIKKVGANIINTEISEVPVLEQNTPNPFDTDTKIAYNIPESASHAGIYIYDLNGNQLKDFTNLGKGNNALIIKAEELNPGMYLYALIVDGKVIDTKRMVLTK